MIGLVVTLSPSRNAEEPDITPETEPSAFCFHLVSLGTPLGAREAAFFTGAFLAGAFFFVGAFFATGAGLLIFGICNVGDLGAGEGFGLLIFGICKVGDLGAGAGFGLLSFGSWKVGDLGAGAGAGFLAFGICEVGDFLGNGFVGDFFAGVGFSVVSPPPKIPNKENVAFGV